MDQPTSRKSMGDVRPDKPASAPQDLPPKTTITVDVASHDGRRTYKGTFGYKVPTIGQRVDIATLTAQYLGEMQVDQTHNNIAESVAYLRVTLDPENMPPWWKEANYGIDLYDYQPIAALYKEARSYEARFLGVGPDTEDDAGSDGAGPGPAPDGDLGLDVQATSERPKVLATFGKGGAGADPYGEDR